MVFSLARAVADQSPIVIANADAAPRLESGLFGGRLPSEYLQTRLFDPGRVDGADIVLSVVDGSFFVSPFVAAGLIWWKRRSLFRQYALATAITFAFGLVGFVLLPTAPPWLSDPDDVTRITHHVLRDTAGVSLGGDDGGTVAREGFWFEPNHLAAVLLVLRSFGRGALAVGAVYAMAMSYSVVYLGEHFVIDAVLGWVVALAGWGIVPRWIAKRRSSMARTRTGMNRHHEGSVTSLFQKARASPTVPSRAASSPDP